jgi:hypothetical protein
MRNLAVAGFLLLMFAAAGRGQEGIVPVEMGCFENHDAMLKNIQHRVNVAYKRWNLDPPQVRFAKDKKGILEWNEPGGSLVWQVRYSTYRCRDDSRPAGFKANYEQFAESRSTKLSTKLALPPK